MNFSEKLKDYMEMLQCTAKDLSDASQLSPATVSRYRSGERVPEPNSDAFDRLCNAIVLLSKKRQCCRAAQPRGCCGKLLVLFGLYRFGSRAVPSKTEHADLRAEDQPIRAVPLHEL